MEKGKAKQLLDRMQVLIEDGQSVPFSSGKVAVDKEDFLNMIDELRRTIDIELKAYHEITDKRNKIIKDAKKEAEDIIVEAEESASRIRQGKPNPIAVSRKVKSLNKNEKQALRTANEIYAASIIYSDEMLMEVNEAVKNAYNSISMETDRILDSLRKKSEIIEQNKRELMEDLVEMKKEERYADILEVSQLLANELYYEKNRYTEEEQPDVEEGPEMVQLEFDFEDRPEKEEIKVRPSRQPVKMADTEIISSDRTPVSSDENIEDGQS